MYSYHIFYFPFKWEIDESEKESLSVCKKKSFSERIDLNQLPKEGNGCWERMATDPENIENEKEKDELFDEQQYFFKFVHNVLYDKGDKESPMILHYERKEPKSGDVSYRISKHTLYELKVDSVNLNFYSTGVGVLTFFLQNDKYEDYEDILNINQYGRRIMPAFHGELTADPKLTAPIEVCGLTGDDKERYTFRPNAHGLSIWTPADFITNLIKDLCDDIKAEPIIDDRMLVNCWYGNNVLSNLAKSSKDFANSDFWYEYVFVDEPGEPTCQNVEMKEALLKAATYTRWQMKGTLYGVSRYSFVALTDKECFSKDVLAIHMRTIYSRMFELVLVQRASVLRFSGEVTNVSGLRADNDDGRESQKAIECLYKEYIRFVNQIYFTYVTAQDQGIELYDMMMKQNSLSEKVKDLDGEISELYQYAGLQMDRKENRNISRLNLIATILLPATVIAGIFGMNTYDEVTSYMCPEMFWIVIGIVVALALSFLPRLITRLRKRNKR